MKVYADRDWSGAEREFQKAIALNPSSAVAHAEYGHKLLSAVMGRYDDALAELEAGAGARPALGVDLHADRLGVLSRAAVGPIHSAVPEDARIGLEVTLAADRLGTELREMGRYEEAIAALEEAAALAGDLTGQRGSRLGLGPGGADRRGAAGAPRAAESGGQAEGRPGCVRLCLFGPGRPRARDRVAAEGL